jgi:hypothetical protein
MSSLSGDKPKARFNPNSVDRLLKWFTSLYRPAVPEEIRARPAPPLSRPSVGASPSGKAGDFDSPMRRFESSRPSLALLFSENFLSLMRKARQMRAFLIADSIRRLAFELFGREFPKVSGLNSEYSRFLEIRPGDPRRSGSVIAYPGGGRCAVHRTRLGPFESMARRCIDGCSRTLYGFASSTSKETTSGWGGQPERPADAPEPGDKPQRGALYRLSIEQAARLKRNSP